MAIINTPSTLLPRIRDKLNKGILIYEDFIGIKQVKEAQEMVLQTETKFKGSRGERRSAQSKLAEVQNQLRTVRQDIDRTARGDVRYLELIKREIEIIKEERDLRSEFEKLEQTERETFSELSNALRTSHQKERAQGEKTKYWSLVGGIIGTALGIVGTSINTRVRHNQTKDILLQTTSHVKQIEDSVQSLALKIGAEMETENRNVLRTSTVSTLPFKKHEESLERSLTGLNAAVKRLEQLTYSNQIDTLKHNTMMGALGEEDVGEEGFLKRDVKIALLSVSLLAFINMAITLMSKS